MVVENYDDMILRLDSTETVPIYFLFFLRILTILILDHSFSFYGKFE